MCVLRYRISTYICCTAFQGTITDRPVNCTVLYMRSNLFAASGYLGGGGRGGGRGLMA
jgi:hypothetical protein